MEEKLNLIKMALDLHDSIPLLCDFTSIFKGSYSLANPFQLDDEKFENYTIKRKVYVIPSDGIISTTIPELNIELKTKYYYHQYLLEWLLTHGPKVNIITAQKSRLSCAERYYFSTIKNENEYFWNNLIPRDEYFNLTLTKEIPDYSTYLFYAEVQKLLPKHVDIFFL